MDAQTRRGTNAVATTSTSEASSHIRSEICRARQPSPPASEKSHETPTSSSLICTGKQAAELVEPTPEVSPIDATVHDSDRAQEQLQPTMGFNASSPVSAKVEKTATTPTSATSQPGAEHEANMPQPQQDTAFQISEQQLRSSYAYCYDRGDGVFTRLIPLDMLPPVGGVRSRNQDNCLGLIVLPQPRAPPPPRSHVGVVETGEWQTHDGSFPDARPPAFEVQSRINDIVDSTVEPNHESPISQPTSRSFDDALSSSQQQHLRQRSQRNNHSSHHNQGLVHGIHGGGHQHQHPSRKRIKIYCDKWVHEGVCAFTQQGCKFKHEMPLDRATQHSLGLFHGLPAWWKKSQQLADASKQQQDAMNQLGQAPPQQMLMLPYHQTGVDSLDGNSGMVGISHTRQDYHTLAAAFDGLQMGPCDNSGSEQQVSVGSQPPFGGADTGAPHLPQGHLFSDPNLGAGNGHNASCFTSFHPSAHLSPHRAWLDSPASQQEQQHRHQGHARSSGLFGPHSHGWNTTDRTGPTMNNNFYHAHHGSGTGHGGSSELPLRRSISEHSPSGQQQHQGVPSQSSMAYRGNLEAHGDVSVGPDHGAGQIEGSTMVCTQNSSNNNFSTPNCNNTGFASRFGPIAPPPLAAHPTAPLTPMSPLPSPAFSNGGRGGAPQGPLRGGGPLSATASRFPMSSSIAATAPHHNRLRFSGHQQHNFVKRGHDQCPIVGPAGGGIGDTERTDVNNARRTKSNPWRSMSENDGSSA